ncbi:MAG: Fe-S-containing hydro-lyase [bacterium]
MPDVISITTPLSDEVIMKLNAWDKVLISGVIYTARDAAHKRFIDSLSSGKDLPFDIRQQVIYYAGPSPSKPGRIIGACGPTTSSRMDKYTPMLIQYGLKGMIGKGKRSDEVKEAIKKYKAIYFSAVGGIAALLSKTVRESEVIAYPDLEPESVRRLFVKDFPTIVAIDAHGRDIFVR